MNATQNQTFSILFWVNKLRENKRNELPIYVRITVDGRRAEMSLHRTTPIELWSQEAQQLKGKGEIQRTINAYIDLTKANILKIYNQLLSEDRHITAELIKQKLIGKGDPLLKTMKDAFDYHNLKMAETVRVGKVVPKTLQRYQITQNKVTAFMKHQYKVSDMVLKEIRLAFITEFEHYLLTVDKLQSNTAHKYIKNLKKIMNMAVGLDWIPKNPFQQFRCSYTAPVREILSEEEIVTIMEKRITIPRLEEVRDVFIFCCFTGMAYTDLLNLEPDDITKTIDGEMWIVKNRQKTGTLQNIMLLPIPLEILEKYKTHPDCIKFNRLLPVKTNQKYNSYLQELADICGINKHLTSHIARHTCATTVLLGNGVSIETIGNMFGHTNIRTTQIYARVYQKKVSDDMKLLREKLNPSSKPLIKIG